MSDLAPTKVELLELDIDTRLVELWAETLTHFGEADLERVGVFIRASYGIGYMDALRDGGELLTVHGYKRPKRKGR